MTRLIQTFGNITVPVAVNTSTKALLEVLEDYGFSMGIEHEVSIGNRRIVSSADAFYVYVDSISEYQLESLKLDSEAWAASFAAVSGCAIETKVPQKLKRGSLAALSLSTQSDFPLSIHVFLGAAHIVLCRQL